MNKFVLVVLIICGASVLNSIQRSLLCPKSKTNRNCLIANVLNSVISLICWASLIYILFFQNKTNKVRNF